MGSNYTMFGPGIMNDTVIPGYGVTMPPVNLNTFWSLPNGTIRAFGGENQYTTYPSGYPSSLYNYAQGFMSPNHISQYNPGLFGVTDFSSSNTPSASLTQTGMQSAYQMGQNTMAQLQINTNIQNISNSLNMMENNLSNTLKQDGFTAAQKATLEGLLEDTRSLKQKYQDQMKAQNPTMEDTQRMQKEIQELKEKIDKKVEEIRQQLADGGTASSTSGSGSSSSSSSSSDNDDAKYLVGTDYENIDPETGKATSVGQAPSSTELNNFCSDVKRSLICTGTKHDILDARVQQINASNIIEIVDTWEKSYGQHTSDGNEGFFAKIFDDVGDGWQNENVPIFLNALMERAEALGISDEISDGIALVNEGLSGRKMWMEWHDDHKIANGLMMIYEKIKAKEAANKTGAQQAIDKGKADHDTEVGNRRTEVEAEKKSELANKMKEQLGLDRVPTLKSGLKVETDDNGEFTGYSIEVNPPQGKITIKATTYQQLALEIEKHGLKVEDVLIMNTRA